MAAVTTPPKQQAYWLKCSLVLLVHTHPLYTVSLSFFVQMDNAMAQELLQWARGRGGVHQRAFVEESLEGSSDQPGPGHCPLTNWFLEMVGLKQLSAVEVHTCLIDCVGVLF